MVGLIAEVKVDGKFLKTHLVAFNLPNKKKVYYLFECFSFPSWRSVTFVHHTKMLSFGNDKLGLFFMGTQVWSCFSQLLGWWNPQTWAHQSSSSVVSFAQWTAGCFLLQILFLEPKSQCSPLASTCWRSPSLLPGRGWAAIPQLHNPSSGFSPGCCLFDLIASAKETCWQLRSRQQWGCVFLMFFPPSF